jgi:hypothetical protein
MCSWALDLQGCAHLSHTSQVFLGWREIVFLKDNSDIEIKKPLTGSGSRLAEKD